MSINPIEIDGGMLEGGGQLLRVTCSIAAIRKQHIIINNIRKNRKNPGLAEQHTVCIKAIGSVCSLDMTNVKVKQITLDFDGTQAISNSSSIIKKKPKKYGFFPRGGGEIVSQITTPTELKPIYLVERGKGLRIVGKLCYTQNTDLKLAEKCCQSMKKSLRKSIRCNGEPLQCSLDCVKVNGGKCKFIQVYVEFEHCRLSSYVVEERNEGWDSLENRVVERLETEFNHGGCCDEYVQDQLLVIMAITKGHSKISTGEISLHSKTVIELMKMMIGSRIYYNKTRWS
ncbi:RNA 3' terminal phosphate cyclase [Entamoeba marina]